MPSTLTLKNLVTIADDQKILKKISCSFQRGKTYAIMGPNGCGKSTLARAIMGDPSISIFPGSEIILDGEAIQHLPAYERARKGIFLSHQSPVSISGVTVFQLLRTALAAKKDALSLHQQLSRYAKELKISNDLLTRSLNEGFSGGERKKMEALQAAVLEPKVIIFDEIDTGVDIDSMKTIIRFLNLHRATDQTRIFITHQTKLLDQLNPDAVLVIKTGKLVKKGDLSLAHQIEKEGFETI